MSSHQYVASSATDPCSSANLAFALPHTSRYNRPRILLSTPPISIDDPSGSRELEAQHIDTSDLHALRVSSCDESTSYVPCLRLLLTSADYVCRLCDNQHTS